jgi:hypothetical protein
MAGKRIRKVEKISGKSKHINIFADQDFLPRPEAQGKQNDNATFTGHTVDAVSVRFTC